MRPLGWLRPLLAGLLLFGALFLVIRQHLQLQLLQTEIAALEGRREALARDLCELDRTLAARTDYAQLVPATGTRGLHSPRGPQVLALAPPPPPAAERPAALLVLELISGAAPVMAAEAHGTPGSPPARSAAGGE